MSFLFNVWFDLPHYSFFVSTIPPPNYLYPERDSNPHLTASKTAASASSATQVYFPTLRLWMSSCTGFLFLKNLLGIPVKNIQHYWEEVCRSPWIPRCPTRAVDILRNHSLSLDSKTLSIPYSLCPKRDSNSHSLNRNRGLNPACLPFHHRGINCQRLTPNVSGLLKLLIQLWRSWSRSSIYSFTHDNWALNRNRTNLS